MRALLARLLAVIGPAGCAAGDGARDVVVPDASSTAAVAVPSGPAPSATAAEPKPKRGARAWMSGPYACTIEDWSRGNPTGVGACLSYADWEAMRALEGQLSCGMCGFVFEPEATKAERRKEPEACCYYTVSPPLGRPLRGGGGEGPITADVGPHAGWTEAATPDAAQLSAEDREALAAAWARDGALEHASVAEFSRLSLALLALAAPSDLVEATHQAALDEVRHAELCFGLASALAGRTLGPGPLDVDRAAPPPLDPVTLALQTLADGCVGETLASLEASRARDLATDPAAVRLLAIVAEDEARHAELAYAIVMWCVRSVDAAGRARIADEARRLATAPARAASPDGPDAARHAAYGRLPPSARAAVLEQGLRDVVRPALLALAERC